MTNDMEQDRQDTQSAFTLLYTIIIYAKNVMLLMFFFATFCYFVYFHPNEMFSAVKAVTF